MFSCLLASFSASCSGLSCSEVFSMISTFNRLCVKAWLAAGTIKRQALGLLLWLLSDSYKITDIKDFQK